jgi:hypothetical protein
LFSSNSFNSLFSVSLVNNNYSNSCIIHPKKNSCIGDQVLVESRREEEERVLEHVRRDDVLLCEYNNRLGSYSSTAVVAFFL